MTIALTFQEIKTLRFKMWFIVALIVSVSASRNNGAIPCGFNSSVPEGPECCYPGPQGPPGPPGPTGPPGPSTSSVEPGLNVNQPQQLLLTSSSSSGYATDGNPINLPSPPSGFSFQRITWNSITTSGSVRPYQNIGFENFDRSPFIFSADVNVAGGVVSPSCPVYIQLVGLINDNFEVVVAVSVTSIVSSSTTVSLSNTIIVESLTPYWIEVSLGSNCGTSATATGLTFTMYKL